MDRIYMSTPSSPTAAPLTKGAKGDVYRKDYIRDGKWLLKSSKAADVVLPVDENRRAKWTNNFNRMKSAGISIPLTVDHEMVLDEATNKLVRKSLVPGMAQARRGEITNLMSEGDRGLFDVLPASPKALEEMQNCPFVSLELSKDFKDAYGNYYDEAITAITLTPKPVIPGQWDEFIKIAASTMVNESDPFLNHSGAVVYLSAEPITTLKTEKAMYSLAIKLALGLTAEATDAQVEARILGQATELSTIKSRPSINLSRDNYDPDGLEGMAVGVGSRIETLSRECKATPAQVTYLKTALLGTPGNRPIICLSQKAATMLSLESPVADIVLKAFELGNPADLLTLTQQGIAQRKVLLSDPAQNTTEVKEDPDLIKRMADGGSVDAGAAAKKFSM